MMRILKSVLHVSVILFLFVGSASCSAQFTWAMVGVNGLTCSACTRTVEMSIRKLNFVKDVQMNLENTDGKIIFNENTEVDLSKVAKAVTDAGFSVRFLHAAFEFSNVEVSNGLCFNSKKFNLEFINIPETKLEGETLLKFLGQQFQPRGEFNKIKQQLVNGCADKNLKVYFVTL